MADAKSGSVLGAENACKFNRQVLYTNPAAVKLIETAIEKLPAAAAGGDEDPKPETKSDRRDRRILSLEQQNAALRAENAGLREKLRRLEQVEDIMVATGRRVS